MTSCVSWASCRRRRACARFVGQSCARGLALSLLAMALSIQVSQLGVAVAAGKAVGQPRNRTKHRRRRGGRGPCSLGRCAPRQGCAGSRFTCSESSGPVDSQPASNQSSGGAGSLCEGSNTSKYLSVNLQLHPVGSARSTFPRFMKRCSRTWV